MVFLIHGQESFLSYQNLTDTKKRFLSKHPDGYNLSVFDNSISYEIRDIKNSLKNYSLFSVKIKLLIIKDFFQERNSKEKEELIEILKEFGNNKTEHIIIFESEDISKDAFYSKIKEAVKEKKCGKLSNSQIEKWIAEKLAQEKISAPAAFIKKIAASGGNLWQINSELEKIICWTAGNSGNLTPDNYPEKMLSEQAENNIFKTIEAVAKKDRILSLKLLNNHLESGENELYLLSMIAYQLRILIKIKSAISGNIPINDLAKKLKIHPFALKKAIPQAKNFEIGELKKSYRKLLKTEEKIKKGANGREELMQFIMNI